MKLYKDQYIVITGGAGMIGSSTLQHLNEKGLSNIIIVDNLGKTEKWKNLVGKRFLDILPKEALFEWLKGRETEIEAFIHLGACSSTVETDASYLLQNNYRFSLQLADYALNHGIRFIYASSAATYGNGELGFNDKEELLPSFQPLNMYGYSKHLFDLWAKQQGVLDRLVGLKYFNVFGPNEYHKGRMASAVFHMTPLIQREGIVKLFKSNDSKYADGDQMRDFIYVKDAARMTCAFLENEACGIFNIGSGKASTWNTLVKAIFKALEVREKIEYIEMPQDLIGKYQNFTEATMDKTAKVLGKEAKCWSLEEAVVDYVKTYLVPGKRW